MPEDQFAEQKTEKPSQRRRKKAREEGNVVQANEVNNAVVLLAALGALTLFGGGLFNAMHNEASRRLGNLQITGFGEDAAVAMMRETVSLVAGAVAPIICVVGIIGLFGNLMQTGVVFAPSKLKPDINQINPIKGAKNLFSMSSLFRLAIAVFKLSIIGVIAFCLIRRRMELIIGLVDRTPTALMEVGRRLSLELILQVAAAMCAIAVADFAWQKHKHEKKLMMTKTEVKEERKREEGLPESKARQARARMEISRMRMMSAVPAADVVVTNPTEIAVAIKWDEKTMTAPKLVAKGRGHLAERIRAVAEENGVPVLERRELARALFAAVDVDMEIPPGLYYAVAEVLAFVYRKIGRAK